METTLSYNPANLETLLCESDEIRVLRKGSYKTDYYVAREKHLDAAEWNSLTSNFLQERDWIAAYMAEEYEDDVEEGIAVLRVTGEGSDIVLLIDPSGYNYARYVGIERASK